MSSVTCLNSRIKIAVKRKTRKRTMSPLMELMRSLMRKLQLMRTGKDMMMSLRLRKCPTRQQRMLKKKRRKRRARLRWPMRESNRKAKIMPQITSLKMLWRTF